jgi:threonine dehydratase
MTATESTLALEDIQAAAERLHGEIIDTPCIPSRTF